MVDSISNRSQPDHSSPEEPAIASGQQQDPDTTSALKTGALIAGSLTPGVGEGIDLYTLFHSESTATDRVLSAGSLLLSVATLGASPNFGIYAKLARSAGQNVPHGMKIADEFARAVAKSTGKTYRHHPPGRSGNWNDALQPRKRTKDNASHYQPFEPDSVYHVGQSVFQTDRNGVVERVSSVLKRGRGFRNSAAQKGAGDSARWSDDHGGHLIAARFGGPGEGINIIAQNGRQNLSGFGNLERQWAKIMHNDPNAIVAVDIRLVPGNDIRPIKLEVNAWVDGKPLYPDGPVLINNFDQPLK